MGETPSFKELGPIVCYNCKEPLALDSVNMSGSPGQGKLSPFVDEFGFAYNFCAICWRKELQKRGEIW